MTCVFDSGVWISALQFGGAPLGALMHALEHHRVAICKPILLEIHSVLTTKFGWADEEVATVLSEFGNDLILIEITGQLHRVCRDPKDDMVFECAVLAKAALIVSGDKDLLSVEQYAGSRVLSPRGYLDTAV